LAQRLDTLSVLQLIFSALAALLMLFAALGFMLIGFYELLAPTSEFGPGNSLQLLMLAASTTFVGVLLLPSAWYALRGLTGHKIPGRVHTKSWLPALGWLSLAGFAIFIGFLVTQQGAPWEYFLPILHVMAVGAICAFFLSIGLQGLPVGSPQRFWGVLGSGLVLGPLIIIIFEIGLLIFFAILAMFGAVSIPGLLEDLLSIVERLQTSPQAIEQLFSLLQPYIASPLVLYAVLVFGAVLVPLLEELFKPAGVWLLYNRPLSPAQGFAAGMISGTGYALFESLAIALGGENWAFTVVSRSGTSLLHIFTSGLVGWGLALAFGQARYLRLAIIYLVAVILHSLWNGLTLISTSGVLLEGEIAASTPLMVFARIAPFGLPFLVALMFGGLLWMNRRLAAGLAEYNQPPSPQPGFGEPGGFVANDPLPDADVPVTDLSMRETHGVD
jgi:hypothetical protein